MMHGVTDYDNDNQNEDIGSLSRKQVKHEVIHTFSPTLAEPFPRKYQESRVRIQYHIYGNLGYGDSGNRLSKEFVFQRF